MSLLDEYFEPFSMLMPDLVSDGEGGYTQNGYRAVPIDAVAIKDQSLSAMVAEREGVTSVYTVTTRKKVALPYHTILRRESDGLILRTTSDPDKATPASASLDMRQVTAEKWELTT